MESIAGENNVQNTTATESMHGWTDAWTDGWIMYSCCTSAQLIYSPFLSCSLFLEGGNKHDETENRGEMQKNCLQFSERILKCKRNLMFVGGDLFIYLIILHYFYSYFLFFA